MSSSVSDIAVGDIVMVQGTVNGTNVTAKTIRDGKLNSGAASQIQGNGQPVVAGSVTAISGDTITITNKSNITYTIDATNAKITIRNQVSSISNVAVGDNLIVQGTVNGNSMVASSVIDQKTTANTNRNNNLSNGKKPNGGLLGGMMNNITSFFKHLFGF